MGEFWTVNNRHQRLAPGSLPPRCVSMSHLGEPAPEPRGRDGGTMEEYDCAAKAKNQEAGARSVDARRSHGAKLVLMEAGQSRFFSLCLRVRLMHVGGIACTLNSQAGTYR